MLGSERNGGIERVVPNVKGVSMAFVFLVSALVWIGSLRYGLSHPYGSKAERYFLAWTQENHLRVQNFLSSLPEVNLFEALGVCDVKESLSSPTPMWPNHKVEQRRLPPAVSCMTRLPPASRASTYFCFPRV